MAENTKKYERKSLIDVSIIISCKNEGNNLKWTLESIMKSKNLLKYEIVVVDDGSEDSCAEFLKLGLGTGEYNNVTLIKTEGIGIAQARNKGVEIARGKHLFFCDAHIKVQEGWLDNLVDTFHAFNADIVAPCIVNMSNSSVASYGITWDNKLNVKWLTNKVKDVAEVPFVCGCTFGITKEIFDKIGGFDVFCYGYGVEDCEICLKAWLYGYKVVVNPYVKVKHLFREKHPYNITSENIIYNTLCVAYSHFTMERLEKSIKMFKTNREYPAAIAHINKNQDLILSQREKHYKQRIYNDDFFFEKFNILF